MRMLIMRLFAMSGVLILPLLVTGCYQQVDEQSLSTAVSQAMPTDTATPTPTPTVTPSPTPRPTRDAEPAASETDSKDAADAQVADADTDILVEVAQAAEDEATPDLVQTLAVTEEAVPADIDPFALTATVIVAQITQTVEFQQTQTAIALGIGATATITPTLTPEPGVTFTPAPLSPGATCVHEIQVGENLFRLSLRYGVTINELALANGITNPNIVLVGQPITIPGCGTTGTVPPATTVPTQSAVAPVAGATPLAGITPAVAVTPAAQAAVTSGRVHVVQQGETLFEISLQYGTTVNALANANGIANINNILIGTEIMIP